MDSNGASSDSPDSNNRADNATEVDSSDHGRIIQDDTNNDSGASSSNHSSSDSSGSSPQPGTQTLPAEDFASEFFRLPEHFQPSPDTVTWYGSRSTPWVMAVPKDPSQSLNSFTGPEALEVAAEFMACCYGPGAVVPEQERLLGGAVQLVPLYPSVSCYRHAHVHLQASSFCALWGISHEQGRLVFACTLPQQYNKLLKLSA